VFRQCRIEAEESTGDLEAFNATGTLTIALDPIDGTQKFRDRTDDGYGVLLHLRHATDVVYSLAFFPEIGSDGTWVQVYGDTVHCGADQPRQPASAVLATLPRMAVRIPSSLPQIYVAGFRHEDQLKAQAVTQTGLQGVPREAVASSIFPLLATGDFAGALFQAPNVYDFPIALHITRSLGGDAVWVHNNAPVHFRDTWLDAEVDMVRLPGIVACAVDRATLHTLVTLARDWKPRRAMG
jgi:3'(2'), 5'-bisphosphate nucleotidase